MLHCSLSARECPGICWLDRAQSRLALYCNLFITTIYVTHLKVCKRWEKERKKEIHTQCAHYLRVARSNTAVHAARVFVGVFVAVSSVEGRYHTVRQAQTWCKSVNLSKKRRKTKREGRKEIFAMLQCLLSRIYVAINQPAGLHEYLCNQVFVWRRQHGWAEVGTY